MQPMNSIPLPPDLRCEDDVKLGSDNFDAGVFLGDDRSSILKLAPLPLLCDDGILLVHAELAKCNGGEQRFPTSHPNFVLYAGRICLVYLETALPLE